MRETLSRVKRFVEMRAVVFLAVVLVTIVLLAGPQAGAQCICSMRNICIPFVAGPDFTFASPIVLGSTTVLMANQSTLAHDFTGSFALAFPEVQGLSPGSPSVFSPVIAQTTSESIAASQSYFFADHIDA
jgi:hypothetical protein